MQYPGYGSVVAKELPSPRDLPPYVAIPNHNFGAGYLGVRYAPLATGAVPRAGQPFSVRGIALQGGLTVKDVERREALLSDLDKAFAGFEANSQLLDGLDKFGQQAYAMITSKRAREAFDVGKESPAFAKPFGDGPFGMSCLLATRLVESGVRFCTVSLGGWDTHANNFPTLKDKLLPQLDVGLSALLGGLAEKGLLESTAVFVTVPESSLKEIGSAPRLDAADGGQSWLVG